MAKEEAAAVAVAPAGAWHGDDAKDLQAGAVSIPVARRSPRTCCGELERSDVGGGRSPALAGAGNEDRSHEPKFDSKQ